MRKSHALALCLLCIPLMSCGNSKDAATIYVLTPPQKASQFTEDLAAISKRHGLDTDLGRATDDKGHTLYVIKAKGHLLYLWGQNMPLSGDENPDLCGHYTEGHPDPGQYIITIDHGLAGIGFNHVLASIVQGKPRTLLLEISAELKESGYDVRQNPVECSPLSKEQADAERH